MSSHLTGPMTDRERARFMSRMEMFRARAADDPEALADACLLRDRDRDPRRMCIECSQYLPKLGECHALRTGRDGICHWTWAKGQKVICAPVMPLQFINCSFFEWATP